MNESRTRLLLGLGLLLLGILFLLQNLGVLENLAALVWFFVFAIAGLVFLGVYVSNRQHWWAIIPGFALLGIGLLIGLSTLFPAWGGVYGGAIFMGALAAAFLIIFALHRENWWALIPGGVLLTIAVVIVADQVFTGDLAGAIMMLGLAATFAILSVIRTPEGRMSWALIPAGVLLVIGLIILLPTLAWMVWVFALLMILAGGYLIFRSLPRAE